MVRVSEEDTPASTGGQTLPSGPTTSICFICYPPGVDGERAAEQTAAGSWDILALPLPSWPRPPLASAPQQAPDRSCQKLRMILAHSWGEMLLFWLDSFISWKLAFNF